MRFSIFLCVAGYAIFPFVSAYASPRSGDLWDPASVREYLDRVATSIDGGDVDIHWGEGVIWYETSSADKTAYFTFDPLTRKTEHVFDQADIRRNLQLSESASVTVIDIEPETKTATVQVDGLKFVLDYEAGQIRDPAKLNASDSPAVVRKMFPINGWDRRELKSPDGSQFASLIGDDFALRDVGISDLRWRTDDGTPENRWFFPGDIWEASDSPWSPDSTKVVARRHDMRSVPGVSLLDYLGDSETSQTFQYWARAGEPIPITSFHIFDSATGARTDVNVGGSSDSFAFFVNWAPDNSGFAFIRYDRDLSQQELFFVDAETGIATRLFADQRDDGWVKWPGGPKTIEYLPSGDGYLWRSDEDGYFHWYLHETNGDRVRQLTQGGFPVWQVVMIDEDGGWIYFMASSDPSRPYDRHLNRIRINGTDQEQITTLPGQHAIEFSPDKQWYIDTHSHLDRPPQTDLYSVADGYVGTLSKAAIDAEFRAGWSKPEEFTAKAADGKTDIHGLIFPPHNFDPDKSYPVLERIYGGMQIPAMKWDYPGFNSGWSGGEYYRMIQYLNAVGFFVVTMDAPGTPGRSRTYNLDTHGSWPEGIIDDHAAALRSVMKTRPYMDAERVGILGNSWGGYMALRGIIEAPELFRAGAASVPETDLVDHVHWIEWQLGNLRDNREHYEAHAIHKMANMIENDVLIIAGTSDVNVPVSNTMKLLDALAEHGKAYDLVIFPGTNHPHQGRGDRYAYAVNKIGVFFRDALGGAEPLDED
ncbi:MAG: alpha/beta fold hydrolase [Pseudomonadota bacterium]